METQATKVAPPARPASYDKAVALVLQGGGALGSYQAGVFQAIADSEYPPDWVAGISIGAINAAIIAGNPLAHRVDRLRAFWESITESAALWPGLPTGTAKADQHLGALHALWLGQPGFFAPRPVLDWFHGAPTSYYDTRPLRATLERLVDFDRINAREMRFSVGAVNVCTGNFTYFDNAHMKIRPEHVMASGALPPGFPPVEIDGELYWDGGLVSNTPLQYVVEYYPRRSRLTFQVDVFHASGPPPADLEDVSEREKDIRYSSRTRVATDTLRTVHNVRHAINELWEMLPEDLRATPAARFLASFSCVTTMDIVQLIYRPDDVQGHHKGYDFSRSTMQARWACGVADANATLRASPWLAPMPAELGARTFDVSRT
ncbi:MAG TPA: patatin-like phospholipase family protein [Acetobacteraceae bacterium]|jgi:NTE family protein